MPTQDGHMNRLEGMINDAMDRMATISIYLVDEAAVHPDAEILRGTGYEGGPMLLTVRNKTTKGFASVKEDDYIGHVRPIKRPRPLGGR